MKFLVSTVLIIMLSFLTGLYLSWWAFALAACLVTIFIRQKPGWAFLSGFLAVFILWAGLAYAMDAPNDSILSAKVAQILPLEGSPWLLMLVTALIGGLVGGGAALTGSYVHKKDTNDE